MDKKQKKRLQIIREQIQRARKRLSGQKQQCDDPAETQRITDEIASLEAEAQKLKAT